MGQPDRDDYRAAVSRAYDFIKREAAKVHFPSAMRHHRRGLYATVVVGLTLGLGQLEPTWVDTKEYTPLVERLIQNKDVARMTAFASGMYHQPVSFYHLPLTLALPAAFALWAPRLHACYVDYNAKISEQFPHLRRVFHKSVFSSAAFNFGPNVWTFKHRDVCNPPFGWCAVQSLGPFDPTKGAHLVLWDLKMVVEFPPGALILLPSATVAHSNVPAQEGDERISFTQFTAGGLFRYIDGAERAEGKEVNSGWEERLKLFSTVDELFTEE